MTRKRQPIQPLITDQHGTTRFQGNAVVEYLLEHGGLDMNDLARQNFPQEDREQFAQLIGYSLSGAGDLSYITDDTYETAENMLRHPDERDARIKMLEVKLEASRKILKELVPVLFRIHPDDLEYLET